MSKPTLLEIVQDILSSTSGEEVNSIFDTVESEQVARVVKDCYEVLITGSDIPEKNGLFELEASTDSGKPTLMSIPSTSQSLDWVKYDCRTSEDTESKMEDMKRVDLETFLDRMYSLSTAEDNVSSFTTTINNASVEIKYRTDVAPSYYTTYDDTNILFDAIDTDVDGVLQKEKTLCYGKLSGTFTLLDTHVLDLDSNMIVLLKQEAKAQAWSEQKLTDNARAERNSRRLMIKMSRDKFNVNHKQGYLNFGRRGAKGGR